MLKIVSILGKKGNGKDYVSSLLIDKLKTRYSTKIQVLAFADKLKEVLSIITGVPLDLFYVQSFKESYMINMKTFDVEEIDNRCQHISKDQQISENVDFWISIRELLQYFGTDVMQNTFGKNVWINSVIKNLNESKFNIITDVRFLTEYNALKDKGAFTIRVENEYVENTDTHASETEADQITADFVIKNNWMHGTDNSNDLNIQLNELLDILSQKWK